MPVQLVRRVDEMILKGIGGFATRSEFILDAMQERLTELLYNVPEVELEAVGHAVTRADDSPALAQVVTLPAEVSPAASPPAAAPQPVTVVDVAETALIGDADGFVLDDGIDEVASGPLFGLHNRDYPSLWATAHLLHLTRSEPIPVAKFYDDVTAAAWEFGDTLAVIEQRTGSKTTALFPTNADKKKAAEGVFRQFAVGSVQRDGERVLTAGPLYKWGFARIARDGDDLMIAGTTLARHVIHRLRGLTVLEPHPPEFAEVFLSHLRATTPLDWWGFKELVGCIGDDGATRLDVVQHFAAVSDGWTENESSTNAGGYVARAREWGLVEQKQQAGKYRLTDLGRQVRDGRLEGENAE